MVYEQFNRARGRVGPNVTLNLGCGNDARSTMINLDIAPLAGVDVVHDITRLPWPIPDDSVNEILALHILEHIPHRLPADDTGLDGLCLVMDEIHRILASGGRLRATFPHHASKDAWRDPTHTRAMTPGWSDYYNPTHPYWKTFGQHYTRRACFAKESQRIVYSLNERKLPIGDYHIHRVFGTPGAAVIARAIGKPRHIETVLRKVDHVGHSGAPARAEQLVLRTS
ncbi:MAG: class I SAM-dependent methyltransferase [Thermoplasmatota archaeon]